MRLVLLACSAAILFAHPALADPAGDALNASADQCIRSQAPAVSRVTPNPTDAVTFLVNDLCGVEIQRATNYETNARMLIDLRANLPPSAITGVSLDPASGELHTPPGFSPPIGVTTSMLSGMRNLLTPQARFRAVAAHAVLAAKSASR